MPRVFRRVPMLGSVLAVCAAAVAEGQAGFPFGAVKTWTGDVSVEVTGTDGTRTITYAASGPVRLSDDMMPDGMHGQWPVPNVGGLSDPRAIENAYRQWAPRVTYKSHDQSGTGKAVGEHVIDCLGQETTRARLQLIAPPAQAQAQVVIELPDVAQVRCTGTVDGQPHDETGPAGFSREVQLQIPVSPGSTGLSGTRDIADGDFRVRVTYALKGER